MCLACNFVFCNHCDAWPHSIFTLLLELVQLLTLCSNKGFILLNLDISR